MRRKRTPSCSEQEVTYQGLELRCESACCFSGTPFLSPFAWRDKDTLMPGPTPRAQASRFWQFSCATKLVHHVPHPVHYVPPQEFAFQLSISNSLLICSVLDERISCFGEIFPWTTRPSTIPEVILHQISLVRVKEL